MLPFKLVPKDRLFYDKFEYCIGFFVEEATALREINHDYVDSILDGRIRYKEDCHRKALQSLQNTSWMMEKQFRPITQVTRERLHEVAETLIRANTEYKSVVSMNNMWVYTNSTELINELDDLTFLLHKHYTRAIINRPRDTIIVRRSRFSMRSHLKSVALTAQQADKLRVFFLRNQGEIRLSPGLNEWCQGVYRRTMDYYFFDYSDPGWIMMISLINPQLLGKTLTITNE